MTLSMYCNIHQIWKYVGGGGEGAGAGVLRGQEAREKCEMLIILI